MKAILAAVTLFLSLGVAAGGAADPITVDLWPSGKPPGQNVEPGPDTVTQNKYGTRVTNVTRPQIELYLPDKEKNTGTAILIVPGGALKDLGWSWEGIAMAKWCAERGIAGIMLKHRVPGAKGAFQDGQRAVSLVRSRAKEWGINPQKIGMMGFSAGGSVTTFVLMNIDQRSYESVDEHDKASTRLNFAALIYSAGSALGNKDGSNALDGPNLTKEKVPPLFFAIAFDDFVLMNNLQSLIPLKKAGIQTEFHMYATGGHGFGGEKKLDIINPAVPLVGDWTHRLVDWMRYQKLLEPQKSQDPKAAAKVQEFTINKRFLILPIKNGAKATELTLEVEGTPVRSYSTELATSRDAVDFYAFFTIESYKGKSAKVTVSRATEEGFGLIRQADEIPASKALYTEDLRPQFHFSQKVGWNNDPNGMTYLDGEWHLFFQHNPVGWKWGNMTWGHAVSKDLLHWQELSDVLFPKTTARGACFSGSAVIDKKNTAGWKTDNNDVLVVFLTDTGAGEAVAYSNDKGRTFVWHQGNPVVKHKGRDPKVFWYAYGKEDGPISNKAKELGGHWVMAVYDEDPKLKRNIAFYTSSDLKDWQVQSHLPGYFECPEIFKLPVDSKADDTRWIVFGADARYAIGKFDGKTFTPENETRHQVHHGAYYASQTFDNAPDGRRIQMGWVKIDMPGMPFNQTFSFPHELTLRKTGDGVRMFAKPIREIEKIHKKKHTAKPQDLAARSPVTLDVAGRLFDIRATFEIGEAQRVGLDIDGNVVAYDASAKKLNGAALTPIDGRVTMQVLVDRPMLEICGNDGAVFITSERGRRGDAGTVKAFADGAGAKLISLEVFELHSTWGK